MIRRHGLVEELKRALDKMQSQSKEIDDIKWIDDNMEQLELEATKML